MKIKFEPHNPEWKLHFEQLYKELHELIGFIDPKIEHIGSTSVEGLSAKPIIDILIGLHVHDLDKVVTPLTGKGYIYYEKYNEDMPYRRFFVKHKPGTTYNSHSQIIRKDDVITVNTHEHNNRLAHIHVLPYNSQHWIRHIAFRDYLRTHPSTKIAYQELKLALVKQEWADGNAYNEAKDWFMKAEEQKAIEWYLSKSTH